MLPPFPSVSTSECAARERHREQPHGARTLGTRPARRASALAGMAAALLLATVAQTGLAQTGDSGDEPAEPEPKRRAETKFTAGHYVGRQGGSANGTDLHLRHRRDDTAVWVGAYRDADFGTQLRTGIEHKWQPWQGVAFSVTPTAQLATRGHVGAGVLLEAGAPWFAQLGVSRTNLRPLSNINFDPQDALTVGLGWRRDEVASYAVTVIRDNRLGTGQQHVHFNGEWRLSGDDRLVIDLLRKTGRGETGDVNATGFSVTWDRQRWFTRLAWDPKQNFGAVDVARVAVGWRY